ncbi:MAG: recombinase family protein, partial [Oscillospiraceae bacterium]|nr:recombinase family protein [Oscillospiraceae bacterium]
MGNRKLPFGYKMVMGEIVVHPQEAQVVQGIYARYLTGASFNDITDHLKEKGPPYDADKPWNKNMVARILEDARYAGTERFPAILS